MGRLRYSRRSCRLGDRMRRVTYVALAIGRVWSTVGFAPSPREAQPNVLRTITDALGWAVLGSGYATALIGKWHLGYVLSAR